MLRAISADRIAVTATVKAKNTFKQGHLYNLIDWMWDNPTEMAIVYSELASTPALIGLKMKVYPYQIEPYQDAYDFSRIWNVVNNLEPMGKQLYIMLQTNSGTVANTVLPEYMRTPLYDGGVYQRAADSNPSVPVGYTSKLWNPNVITRLNALITEIARVFGKHPVFAGIVFVETAMAPPVSGTFTITQQMEDDNFAGFLSMEAAAKIAAPNGVIIQFANYPRLQLETFIPALDALKVGLGTPDTLEDEPGLNFNKTTNPNTPEGVYAYYPPRKGLIPLLGSVQPINYLSTTKDGTGPVPTIQQLFDFNRDNLQVDLLAWTRQTPYYPGVLTFLNSPAIANSPTFGLIENDGSGF